MIITEINEDIINRIKNGNEKAFSLLYKAYYTYLNTLAICYVFDKNTANEIVNDIFINVWYKRETLSYPIHSYLVRSVQNRCLNHIRAQKNQQNVLDKHRDQMLAFQENYIQSTPLPLQYVEMHQTEEEIRLAVKQLPSKCRIIFEEFFYAGKTVDRIANDMGVTVSTIRVQLKNATDRLKQVLKHLLSL